MSFPKELAALRQWICWRLEPDSKSDKPRKVPYDPKTGRKASSTNADTWATLAEAQAACQKFMFTGIGFVFTSEAGIVGVDIDHCSSRTVRVRARCSGAAEPLQGCPRPSSLAAQGLEEDGSFNDTASAILERFPSYTEISPSGTGLHIFYHGAMPGKGNKNSASGVEMYAAARYFTMTGQRLQGTPEEIADGAEALPWIHDAYIAKQRKKKEKSKKAQRAVVLTDEQVLEKARAAQNGEEFAQLWAGQWEGRYGSQSEADLALCCSLAFWTGKGREQMDRLFRQSGLFREKWDKVHHASGATYGEETLEQAIQRTAIWIAGLEWIVKHGVTALGLHEYGGLWAFVGRERAFMAGGEEMPDAVQLEKYASIESDVPDHAPIEAEKLGNLGPLLLEYNEPAKTITVLGCCMAGLRLMEATCARLGMAWGQVFPIGLDACAAHKEYAAREYLLDGDESNKSVVEQTLEVMDRMGLTVEECRMLDDGNIAFWLRGIYDRYTQYRRDHAILGECLGYGQFMKQLRKSDLYVETRTARIGETLRCAIILDYPQLKRRCDIEGFLQTQVEPLTGRNL